MEKKNREQRRREKFGHAGGATTRADPLAVTARPTLRIRRRGSQLKGRCRFRGARPEPMSTPRLLMRAGKGHDPTGQIRQRRASQESVIASSIRKDRAVEATFSRLRSLPLTVPAIALLLVIGALGFRLIGIDFGRPYIYHPDEYAIAKPGILMAQYNGWNPHAYYYPSALMYAEKAIAIAVHHFAHAPYESTIAYGFDTAAYRAYYEAIPEQFDFYLAGRILVAILGSLTVAITFAAGRAAAGLTGGFAAAIFVALAPLAVVHAHYLTSRYCP